jgi:molybdopterin biosynthesis enzyme MoaB
MKSFLSLNISIFIISDSRNERSDRSGKVLEKRIEESGHKLAEKVFIEDEEKLILKFLKKSIKKKMLM